MLRNLFVSEANQVFMLYVGVLLLIFATPLFAGRHY